MYTDSVGMIENLVAHGRKLVTIVDPHIKKDSGEYRSAVTIETLTLVGFHPGARKKQKQKCWGGGGGDEQHIKCFTGKGKFFRFNS